MLIKVVFLVLLLHVFTGYSYQTNIRINKFSSHTSYHEAGRDSMMPNVKWNEAMLRDEALKYKTRNEFRKGPTKAYQAAFKRGILDEICQHMDASNNKNNTKTQ
jgi:hypothetical protein